MWGRPWDGLDGSRSSENRVGEAVAVPLHPEVASNPFHDFNVVYLPYGDGSVFSGDNDAVGRQAQLADAS